MGASEYEWGDGMGKRNRSEDDEPEVSGSNVFVLHFQLSRSDIFQRRQNHNCLASGLFNYKEDLFSDNLLVFESEFEMWRNR